MHATKRLALARPERRTTARAAGCAAAVTALVGLTVSGCSTESSASSASSSASGPITIGIANQQESVTFPAALAQGAQDAAKALGIKVISLDSQGDQAKQASQVQDLISQKVSGIILVPLSPGPAQALVDQAATANIPIATMHGTVGANRDVSNPYEKLKFIVDENEVGAGATAGQMALTALPQGGKVAVITGAAGFAENTLRVQKFTAALSGAGAGKYTVVATQPGNWTKEEGRAACQNILAANPDTGLFYAISDDMAVGCSAAVQAAKSNAKVIGIGGSKSGIAAIKTGEIYGTVCYKPYDEGKMAVQMMHDVITGKLTGAPKTTFYDTPGVTKANVDSCTPQW